MISFLCYVSAYILNLKCLAVSPFAMPKSKGMSAIICLMRYPITNPVFNEQSICFPPKNIPKFQRFTLKLTSSLVLHMNSYAQVLARYHLAHFTCHITAQ